MLQRNEELKRSRTMMAPPLLAWRIYHVVASDIRWVEEHPTDASIIFVGKTGGLVRLRGWWAQF